MRPHEQAIGVDLVSNDAGELVRREHARDLGGEVVIAIYRLLRLARMHDLQNKAFVSQLENTHSGIQEYCLRSGMAVNVLFAQRAVFVAGQLLKGSRGIYDSATELGEMLAWCGGSELTIQREVTQAELRSFAQAVNVALRGEEGKGLGGISPRIRLRPVSEAARLRGLEVEELPHEQKVVRTYATAVVIMRRLFEDLAAGKLVLPRRVKRVAQKLVDLSEGATPAYLGVTEMRNANHDDAGRAVNGAILAVSMARQLTQDRSLLAQLAMGAMLHDVGRPRAVALQSAGGPALSGIAAALTDDAEDRLAAGTAAVLTALGRLNEASITRTVIAFESLWLRRASNLGPTYFGVRSPTLQARMIAVARRYNDLLTPEPGLPAPPPDLAVGTLWSELTEPAQRVVVRLLVSALRIYPVGTVVGLSTGEVAEVIGTPRANGSGAASGLPLVRVVMDSAGEVLEQPIEVDLEGSDPPREIVKVLSVEGWVKGKDLSFEGEGPTPGEDTDRPPWEQGRTGQPQVRPPSVPRVVEAEAPDPPAKPRAAAPDRSPPPAVRARLAPSPPARAPIAAPLTGGSTPALSPPGAPIARAVARAPAATPPASAPIGMPVAASAEPAAAAEPAGRPIATPPPRSERETKPPPARRGPIAPPMPAAAPPDAAATAAGAPSEDSSGSDSFASLGSSPSSVAAAMGLAMRPPAVTPVPAKDEPRAAVPDDRTIADDRPPIAWSRRLEDAPPPQPVRPTAGPLPSAPTGQDEVASLVPRDVAPAAHGTLAGTPVAHILVYMLDHGCSGSITFHEPDGWEHIVTVRDGAPVMAKTERPIALLGHELAARGIKRDVITKAALSARTIGLLLGQQLMGEGVISEADLADALSSQVVHKVAGLANLPEATRYAYYPGRDFLENWAGAEVFPAEPLTTVLECVRGWMDRARILGTLGRIGTLPLDLHPQSNCSSLTLSADERAVFDLIAAGACTLPDLLDRRLTDVEVVRSLVYMLAITRQFHFSSSRGAPMRGGKRGHTSHPRRHTPSHPSFSKVSQVIDLPPEMLADGAGRAGFEGSTSAERATLPEVPDGLVDEADEVAVDVDESDVEVAVEVDDSDVQAATAGDVDSIDAQWSDDATEDGQVPGLPEGADPAQRLLDAMNDFRLAQDALDRGELREAEELALRAVDGDPEQVDHLALLAWIRAQQGDAATVEESIATLTDVLDMEPGLIRALLYRGRLYKRTKRLEEALGDFEEVLQHNPRHQEATSEVAALRRRPRR
ncbi:MAG: tetratricopeptide repeat protein [Deltaproteobacteria bacterium]|nr:tetratricopeptide repeat protein [Deltaproteobacteria bacterium]